MNVRIQGLDKLTKRLKELRGDSSSVIEGALLKAGQAVRNRAVMMCPVDTGELRNSIRTELEAPLTVSVGTNKEYAVFVEYGTGAPGDPSVPHTAKKEWRYQDEEGVWHTCTGTQAQPFLRPAFREDEIVSVVKSAIEEAVNGD